jgi:dolichol-phosphate mannosyltransferase
VDYVRPERVFGVTTNSLRKNLGWARKAILSFSYAPLDFITLLAVTICGISAVLILFQILARIFAPQLVPTGITTLIVLILFMGGIQLLCLSIIGSYLAHLYDEVKRRPSYIRESVINAPEPRQLNATEAEGPPSNPDG